MEEILKNSSQYIIDTFPEVEIRESKAGTVFEGRFIINAKKGAFAIHVAPLLKIVMDKSYPEILPICYDVNKTIEYDHVNQNGALCVSTDIDLAKQLKSSVNIKDYIEKFIFPYFLSYKYWQKTGNDLFGDRSHGREGIYEALHDLFPNAKITNFELKHLLCWASESKKFRKSVPTDLQIKFLTTYIPLMKELRKLGIVVLRKQYKML